METNLICPGCGERIHTEQPQAYSAVLTPGGKLVREWRHRDCPEHPPAVMDLMAGAMEAEERGLVDGGEGQP